MVFCMSSCLCCLLERPVRMCFLLRRHEGWLELDAYYTGANRGVDPSDLAAGPPKPNEALILPNDSAADLTSPQGSGRAAKSGAADDSVTRSASRRIAPVTTHATHFTAFHLAWRATCKIAVYPAYQTVDEAKSLS